MATKRRRIRFHRRLSMLLAVLLSLVIIFTILKRSAFLPYQISKYVNEHYFKGTPFSFSCSRVTGDLVNLIRFEKLALEYDDGRESYNVFWVDEVEIDYQLTSLVGLKLFIDNLSLKDVRIRLEQDKAGRLVLPIPEAPVDQAGGEMAAHVQVAKYDIDGLMVYFSGGQRNLRIRDVFLSGSLSYIGSEGMLTVDRGTGYLIDTETSINALSTQVLFSGPDVRLREFVTRLDQSYIMATGGYEGGRFDHLQLVFNPVDLKELSDIGIMPPTQGQLGGNIICEGPLDSLSIKGLLTGNGFGLVLTGFSFDGLLTPERLAFNQVNGTVFGSRVEGALVYDLDQNGGIVFDGSCSGLDLSQGFIPSEDTPDTDLFGDVRVEYQKTTGTYRFSADLDSLAVAGFEAGPSVISGSYQSGRGALIDDLEIRRPGFILSASGRVDDDTQSDVLFKFQGTDYEYLWQYLSLPDIGGRLDVSGRMTGPLNNFQINLNGECRDLTYLFATVNRGTIQAQIGNIPSDSVSAMVDLRGDSIALDGRTFDRPHVLLDAGGGITAIRDFSFARGDTMVTMDFDVSVDSAGSTITFKHLSIAAEGEDWNILQPVELRLTEHTAALDSFVLASRYGTIGMVGNYSTERRSCQLSGWGTTIDLALIKDAFDLPVVFRGRGDFNLEMAGALDNPHLDFSLNLDRGQIDSLSFDHLELHSTFSPGAGYRLERLVFRSNGDSLEASGNWQLPDSPVRIVREGFDRDRALKYPLNLEADVVSYPLIDIFRGLHIGRRPNGEFTGNVKVSRSASDPQLELTGTFSGAEKGGLHLPDVHCELFYADSVLNLRSVQFDDGLTSGRAQATVALVLNIFDGVTFRPSDPIQISCEVRSSDISSLNPYIDQTGDLAGQMEAAVSLSGSVERPSFGGQVTVKRGAVRLSGMETRYKDIELQARLDGNRIELADLNGRDEKKGWFNGSGYIRLNGFRPDQYDITFKFDELDLAPSLDLSSVVNGSIKIVSSHLPDGRTVPSLTGSVYVREAQVLLALESSGGVNGSSRGPTITPGWIANIDIEAPKNVWVRNPDLRMELGGDVIFKRDERGNYLRGQLQILRGTYNLYNNKFRITEGEFDFSKGYAFRPEMMLTAYTPYRREGDREHRIYLHVSWPIDKLEPEVTLSYDEPGYSETDIWRMLGGTYVSSGDRTGESSWDARGTAQGFASNYLERILSEQMTDLTIEVETRAPGSRYDSSNREHEMSIAVGKYLSEDLYLKYRQGLAIGGAREVEIEYRLSNMLIIRSEIIRHSDKLYFGQRRQVSDEINLDFKFRFEY